MRAVAVVLATALMAACASTKPVYLPDGRQGYSVDCSGTVRTWGQCLEKAGAACGSRGYEVVDQAGNNSFVHNTMGGNFQVIPTASRTMIIACK
jgi:hypothetical protein